MQPTIHVSWKTRKKQVTPTLNDIDSNSNSNRDVSLDLEFPSLLTLGSPLLTKDIIKEELPSRVESYYKDDFNILDIHNLILKRFESNRKGRIEELQKELTIENNKLKTIQTIIDYNITRSLIAKLTKQIENLNNRNDIIEYEESVADLIEMYKTLGTTKIISFKKDTKIISLNETSDESKLRHTIIREYLEIARKYIQIDVIREYPNNNNCPGCKLNYSEMIMDDENGISFCPKCGIERYHLIRTSLNNDLTKIQTNTRNGYDDRDNFYKALLRYQGKQQNRLPENLISVLDIYFESFGLSVSEHIRSLPLNPDGKTRGQTTREMMYRALYETGYAIYYEDVNLICHIYWGWILPDISHIEDDIMEDYDKVQKIYESLPKNRKSNLNTQYRLFKHLQLRGCQCSIDDFKMVKTREILEYHDATWQIMVTEAGLPFIPTI